MKALLIRCAGWAVGGTVLAALSLCGGCGTTPVPEELEAESPLPDRDRLAAAVLDNARPVELSEAVAYALATSTRVGAMRASIYRAAGRTAEVTTPKSPEFRFGFGREDQDERGWSEGTETGTTRQSRTMNESSRQEGTENTASSQFQGGVLDETSTGSRYSTRNSRGTSTSRETSNYSSSTYSSDIGDQSEDSLRLGLRYYPPNPWMMAAAGAAALAEQWMTQAELVVEEHDLICDTVEAAIHIAYGERALRVHETFAEKCRELHDEMQKAMEDGNLRREDYLDARMRWSAAVVDREREADRLESWRQKFRMITGIDPSRVVFNTVEAGVICPVSVTGGVSQASDLAQALAPKRPDVLVAHWNRLRYEEEWKETRAANYPWLTHIEVSHTRWDSSDERYRTTEKNRSESGSISRSSSALENSFDSEQRVSSLGESEFRTGSGTAWESSTGSGTEYESSTGSGTEASFQELDGEEWWVGMAMEIPIFEWMSRQDNERHLAMQESRRIFEAGRTRAEREIMMAVEVLRKSRAELEQFLKLFDDDRRDIECFADASEQMGPKGRLEAMQLRERIGQIVVMSYDRALRAALDELYFCRVTGLAPGQPPPVASAAAAPAAQEPAGAMPAVQEPVPAQPAETPPVEVVPSEESPAKDPAAEAPPGEKPEMEDPPAEIPPEDQPVMEAPMPEDPPAEEPVVETPPLPE